jgi:hypothetical protein
VLDSKRGGAKGGKGATVVLGPFQSRAWWGKQGVVRLGRATRRSKEGGPGRRAASGRHDLGAMTTGGQRLWHAARARACLDRGNGRGTDMRAQGYSAPQVIQTLLNLNFKLV